MAEVDPRVRSVILSGLAGRGKCMVARHPDVEHDPDGKLCDRYGRATFKPLICSRV